MAEKKMIFTRSDGILHGCPQFSCHCCSQFNHFSSYARMGDKLLSLVYANEDSAEPVEMEKYCKKRFKPKFPGITRIELNKIWITRNSYKNRSTVWPLYTHYGWDMWPKSDMGQIDFGWGQGFGCQWAHIMANVWLRLFVWPTPDLGLVSLAHTWNGSVCFGLRLMVCPFSFAYTQFPIWTRYWPAKQTKYWVF